jgi:hypothetical protein
VQHHVPRWSARPPVVSPMILITVSVETSPNLTPPGSPGGDACGEPDGNRVLMYQPTGSYRPASDADQRLALSGKQRASGINGSRCVTFVGVASFLNLITEYKPTMLKTLRGLTSGMRKLHNAAYSDTERYYTLCILRHPHVRISYALQVYPMPHAASNRSGQPRYSSQDNSPRAIPPRICHKPVFTGALRPCPIAAAATAP